MRAILFLAIMIAVLTATGAEAPTAPSAAQLLAKAKTQAAEEHKSIFVVFDASW